MDSRTCKDLHVSLKDFNLALNSFKYLFYFIKVNYYIQNYLVRPRYTNIILHICP